MLPDCFIARTEQQRHKSIFGRQAALETTLKLESQSVNVDGYSEKIRQTLFRETVAINLRLRIDDDIITAALVSIVVNGCTATGGIGAICFVFKDHAGITAHVHIVVVCHLITASGC
jgi:hypothetical protein